MILIVDDSQVNLTLYSSLIEKIEDTESIQFIDPKLAIAWCKINNPDLVLLDYMMPEINGIEFLGLFRKIEGNSNTPVIMVTTQSQLDIRDIALQATANDFINKPIDKTEFLERVKNMLALRETQIKLK